MSLLGVDVGTSGVRVVALSTSGTEIGAAGRTTHLRRPGPGMVEIDAEEILAVVIALLGEVSAHAAGTDDHPEGLSFSVQGEAVVPVDRNGHALAPAPVSMDQRGADIARRIAAQVGRDEVHRITGQPSHPMFSIYKIAAGGLGWTGPAVFGYRCLGDYLAARLGGRPAMDTSMAARTGGFDVGGATWSADLLALAGIPAGSMPEVVAPGTAIGKLSVEVATAAGLPAGLPVVVGSHDQASAFLGGGGRCGEISVASFGSSDCLTVGSPVRPPTPVGTGLASYPMGDAGWLTLAGTSAGGWTLDWFARLVGVSGHAERDALFESAAGEPSDVLVLPYFAGSGTVDNDPHARGAVFGLTLETTREQLARAFLEAFGFEIRKIVDALGQRGVPIGEVHAVGGGARSVRSLGMRAAAAGIALTPVPGHAAARGAALQAGVGIGRYASFADLPVPARLAPIAPDPGTAVWYAAQSRRFHDLYAALVAHDRNRIDPSNSGKEFDGISHVAPSTGRGA
jgi:xylulokinase